MKKIEVVAAVIFRGNDPSSREVFATQRGYGEFKGWWEFPGGKMEAGESGPDALAREIREELNAEISVGALLKTVEWDYPTFHLTMHCYECGLVSESLHLNVHEDSAWLDSDNLESVNWLPADLEVLPFVKELL